MNVLFASPLGAMLARPWVDPVGLFGLRRWYLPLSRLWAAANAADGDVARFRDEIGSRLPAAWPDAVISGLLVRHDKARSAADAARHAWEEAIFSGGEVDAGALDRRRRAAATRHLATRAIFYPLLFPRRPAVARWRIEPPEDVERALGPLIGNPAALYGAPLDVGTISVSQSFSRNGLKEYWLRAPTPSVRLRHRAGSEAMYARVVEPADGASKATLIIGSGLCLEFELLTVARDPGARLAAGGWRVIEPISPYHGLRAMPGSYGGEPFFAAAPTSAFDLIAGQAVETALLTAWSRARFGGKVAVAGISMTSFVAQQVASYCTLWPELARPHAAMLISHSGRVEDATFGGALAAALGLDRALIDAGWSREALARLSAAIDPAEVPALPPSRIVSVLGETDRWLPYADGHAVAQRWELPADNLFRYRLGHLGMPVQLTRDPAPFERLMQVLGDA
jgi:hypothetical protein